MSKRQPTPEGMCEDRFTYKQGDLEIINPSKASARARHLERYTTREEFENAIRDTYKGNSRPLCKLLREKRHLIDDDVWDALVGLVADGKWRKRDTPTTIEQFESLIFYTAKQQEALIRAKNGGRLPRNERLKVVTRIMTSMVENDEFRVVKNEKTGRDEAIDVIHLNLMVENVIGRLRRGKKSSGGRSRTEPRG
jgi:hypothetical protein